MMNMTQTLGWTRENYNHSSPSSWRQILGKQERAIRKRMTSVTECVAQHLGNESEGRDEMKQACPSRQGSRGGQGSGGKGDRTS